MYLQHWSLRFAPFRPPVRAGWFYQGPVQEESLARLQFLVQHRRPLGAVVGGAGVGKSLLFEVYHEKLRQAGKAAVHLTLAGLDNREFLWKLAGGLDLNPGLTDDAFRLWRRIGDRLAQHRTIGRDLVLLLDDFDAAEPDCWQGLLRLLALNRFAEARITAIVAGRPDGLDRLPDRLVEQTELRIELEPFSEEDTFAYVRERLTQAGRADRLFSNAALSRLHELSAGSVRMINDLAELALVAAAAQDMECVDTEIVDGAYSELGHVEFRRRAA